MLKNSEILSNLQSTSKALVSIEEETRVVSVTLSTTAKLNLGDYSGVDALVSVRLDVGTLETRTVDAIAKDYAPLLRGALLEQLAGALEKRVLVIERLIKAMPPDMSASAAQELQTIKIALRLANAQDV